jgi:hypothetical protein
MARLRTLNRRRRRKTNGPMLKPADFARFTLCNRFAASSEGRMLIVGPPPEGGHYALRFPEAFYTLKDRILHRYGRAAGLALQHWTSYAHDYGDYDSGLKDGCHHYHILERTRLRGRIYHKPTGHFYWSNEVSEDYKRTVGFDELKEQCVERLEGKKRVTRAVPDKREAFHALKVLWRRFRFLPERPAEPKPRVQVGNYYGEHWARRMEIERQERAAMDVKCHYCLKEFKGSETARIDGHEFCATCKAKAFNLETVPF